jgi:Na+/proline symporter
VIFLYFLVIGLIIGIIVYIKERSVEWAVGGGIAATVLSWLASVVLRFLFF